MSITLEEIRNEFEGKLISRRGYAPIGRVSKVDESGAWLTGNHNARIAIQGLSFYYQYNENEVTKSKY